MELGLCHHYSYDVTSVWLVLSPLLEDPGVYLGRLIEVLRTVS